MSFNLADDIIAGMLKREDGEFPYAQLDVIKLNDEKTPVATVRALRANSLQIEVDWYDESYKDNEAVQKLMQQARGEVLMFVISGGM